MANYGRKTWLPWVCLIPSKKQHQSKGMVVHDIWNRYAWGKGSEDKLIGIQVGGDEREAEIGICTWGQLESGTWHMQVALANL